MKNIVFALVAFTLLLGTVPGITTASAAPYRYSDRDPGGWPRWIGRLDTLNTNKLRPEMAAKYLPLSLIKTGRLEEILREVENTPNVDTRNWPSWIGKLR